MTATVIQRPAGTARPLLSGGWAVDFGDPIPMWVPDKQRALDELAARTAAKPRSNP